MKRLQQYIDNELMVSKARAAGMDRTPEFADRTAEYRKTRLINVQRERWCRAGCRPMTRCGIITWSTWT